ncbi:MAG: hypothetical protein Q9O74_05535 [Planctomycetota bacterium]|nr:hypothetical protein [Planctomycetota bacterium]
MASRSDDSKAGSGAGPGDRAAKAGSARRRPSADAVERALAEVSQTLDRLKQVRAERAEAEARFQAELQARDDQIAAAEAALKAEREARAGAEARIESAQQVAESELERINTELDEVKQRFAEKLSAMESAVEREAAAATALETERDRAVQQAEQLAKDLATAERDMALQREAMAEFESRLAEADVLREQVTKLTSEIAAAHERVEVLEADGQKSLAAAEAQAEDLLQQLLKAEAQSEERSAQFEASVAEIESRAGVAEARAIELESALQETKAELESVTAQLEARATAAEQAAEQAAEEAAENARVLESTLARQRDELERLGREVEEYRAANRAAEQQHAELAERLSTVERSAIEAAERFGTERQEQAAALEAEREHVREMTEKLDLAADRIDELQQTLEEREQEIQDDGKFEESMAALTGELHELREQLDGAERERDALRYQGEPAAGGNTSTWDDARLALRRQRLRRARQLLREHASKADHVEEVLAQRMEQCEDVLSRRRELVQAREVIERAHKKVVSTKSRSGAAAMVFFGLGTLALLAGISWAVVTRSFPARYAASGVLAAEFTETSPTPEALKSWQEFHEKLLLDPQLMSHCAERLAQRGFAELGQPAALKVMLKNEMTWSSPEPGKLMFELKGQGREATARALETYLTSLIAQSSALRQRRSETSTTVIAEPVQAGNEPIEDPRLAYAGIGLGAGALLCLLLWFGIWKRMAKTKTAFENSAAVDHLLEDARWVDPIQKIIDSPGDGSGKKVA